MCHTADAAATESQGDVHIVISRYGMIINDPMDVLYHSGIRMNLIKDANQNDTSFKNGIDVDQLEVIGDGSSGQAPGVRVLSFPSDANGQPHRAQIRVDSRGDERTSEPEAIDRAC